VANSSGQEAIASAPATQSIVSYSRLQATTLLEKRVLSGYLVKMEEIIIEGLVDFFDVENKSAQEVLEIFQRVMNMVFKDNIINQKRLLALEKLASYFVKRASYYDSFLLSTMLTYRIDMARVGANLV